MKYISFKTADGDEPSRIGVVLDSGAWLDLNRACRARYLANGGSIAAASRIANALIPGNMVDFMEIGDTCRQITDDVVTWYEAQADRDHLVVDPESVTLLPPIPRPPMLRDFMGFETHLLNLYPKLGRSIPPEWYELPVYYKGNPGSLGADGDDVQIPGYANELDYEFELGMVIGKSGIDIPRDRAMEHVFGFMIYNDFSARKIQGQEMAVGLGPAKGKDFVGGHVFGPYLVTLDEVGDPYTLGMRAYVNDTLVCDDSTATMHWKFEDMIAHASRSERLVVGEIFGSGTVGNGSGGERDLALHPGDTTRLEVDRMGTLTNRIVGGF
jgi:2-keto-4-pentenoate hydratase/2-oxohepta-3-ene-1,7-dioic acid hydratase in catechol pathway